MVSDHHNASNGPVVTITAETLVKKIRNLPSLPDVVNKIVELLNQPNTPAAQVANLMSYDPGLSTRVLRLVNSSAYGFTRQISSIQHAVMILGFSTAKSLVLSAGIFEMFSHKDNIQMDELTAFWNHSMSTAVGAKMIAEVYKLPGIAEEAFSAGMLHDVGKVLLEFYLEPNPLNVLATYIDEEDRGNRKALTETELHYLGMTHLDVGGLLAAKWKLPIGFQESIAYHHAPHQAQNCQQLVYVVALADQLSHVHRLGQDPCDPSHYLPEVLDYFEADEEVLTVLAENMNTAMDETKELVDNMMH